MRPRREEIGEEAARILQSGLFQHSGRMGRFLSFVVEKSLNGEQNQIKEYVLGVEVYEKGADFDPRIDSTVRVEASRLRAKLREYYETEGRNNRIRIEMPKGGYTPVFRLSEAERAAPRSFFRRFAWQGALFLAAASLALVLLQVNSRPAANLFPPPHPLTAWPGVEIQPAVSPDGTRVAVAWNGPKGDNFDIYVLRIGEDSPARLTFDPAADRSPAWSRDGQSIAFIRDSATGRQLHTVASSGGSSRLVATLQTPAMFPNLNLPRLIEWSHDGRHLLAADRDSPDGPDCLYLVSIETREKRRLTSPPQGWIGDRDPSVAAGGRYVAFTRSPSPVTSDLYLMPLEGGEPRRLTFLNRPIRGIAWTEDDRSIVFSSERDATAGSGALLRVSVNGSDPEPRVERVLGIGPRAALPSVARRGRILAYQQSFQDSDIWRFPLTMPGDPVPVISSTQEEGLPDYSPDGARLTFCSNRTGHWEIWVADADGSNQRQLTRFAGAAAAAPRWSADGRFIAFVRHSPEGSSDVYMMAAEGGSIRRLTTHPARDESPSWSKTGQDLYFHSNRTGDFEVWKLRAGDPERLVQVTRGGGTEPVEDPTGRHLYYRKRGFAEIWRTTPAGGPEVFVLRTAPSWRWVVGRRGIYLSDPGEGLIFFDVAEERRKVIARFSSPAVADLAISPDESWALCGRRAGAGSDIMVVEGFR
jgi:Tol biopolymer transport system component